MMSDFPVFAPETHSLTPEDGDKVLLMERFSVDPGS